MVLITLKHTQKPQTLPSSMQLNGYELPLFPSVRSLDVPLDRSPFPATRIPYTSGLLSQTPANQFYPTISLAMLPGLNCGFVLLFFFLPRTDHYNLLLARCPKNLICIQCCWSCPSFSQVWPPVSDPHLLRVESRAQHTILLLAFNRWTAKPIPICLISPSCMFRPTSCSSAWLLRL